MSQNKFTIKPNKSFCFLHTTIETEVSQIDQVLCESSLAKKLQFTVTFTNYCFSVKRNYELNFGTDSFQAQLCNSPDQNCETLDKRTSVRYLPLKQQYWLIDKKKSVQFLCWKPTIQDPDFNVNIDINITPYSQDLDEAQLEDLKDSITIIVHGEEI